MRNFDPEERRIHAAFSQIKVKHEGLAARVKRRIGEPPTHTPRRTRRVPLLVAALVILLISTTALAVGLNGFDRFMERFNPAFAEVVEPVGAYSEDQGILMTVIGAQRFGNTALVYLSVQDVSGENRLTETMSFLDGFRIGAPTGGVSWWQTILSFDEASNTAYFEFQATFDLGLPQTGPLEIGASRIFLETYMFWDEPMELSLANLGEAATIPIVEEEHMFTGSWDFENPPAPFDRILVPGHFGPMPHGDPSQWFSNIGIVDGQLRVQYAGCYDTRNRQLGPGDASFSLLSLEGEVVWPTQNIAILFDENLAPLSRYDLWPSGILPHYRVEEYIFDLDLSRLPYYTLLYTGHASRGIAGNWRVSVDTGDTDQQVIMLTNDVPLDGILFELITLTPLGLEVRGAAGPVAEMPVIYAQIETANGLISLGEGGWISFGDRHYDFHWHTDAPLDLTATTAIIINDLRIPIP